MAACESAYSRLTAADHAGPEQDPYQSVGEALFWLYALAEERERLADQLILGLAWARDCIAHGLLVAAPTQHSGAGTYGGSTYGGGPYGGWTELTWLPRDQIQVNPLKRSDPRKEDAYDRNVAGRQVTVTVQAALRFLGAKV